MKLQLTDEDFQKAASTLGCSVPMLKAVASVESKGSGFLPSGEPKILYEPHIFSRLTKHRFDGSHPNLSYKRWKSGAYGPESAQHAKLQAAVLLDKDAALQSCSWGEFQVMGFNWGVCKYPSLQAFINDAYVGADGHLRMFLGYVKGRGLVDELQREDVDGFALGYNGPDYKLHNYDSRLSKALTKFKKEGA